MDYRAECNETGSEEIHNYLTEEKKVAVAELVNSILQNTSYGETVIELVVEAIISKKWSTVLPKIVCEIHELLEEYAEDLLSEPTPVSMDEAKAMFPK